ncbi:ribosomal protein L9, N-terminal domain [Ceratobasidium sp. AG-Ba]|nr:ribosomal protein L9, N-terminal domain [Ceratobasidium sp. AG-Ba]
MKYNSAIGILPRCALNSLRTPTVFTRNASRHRTIQVQLTADVPGLGAFGTVQTVNPGRMRNQLFPLGQAAYIPRGATPKLLERPRDPNGPVVPDIDFTELELSLRELPELVFRRKIRRTAPDNADPSSILAGQTQPRTNPSSKSHAIFGSVAPADVLQRLSDSHHITLVPPNALLDFNDASAKLKSTGKHRVTVNLRNGAKIPLVVTIEGDE